MIMNFLPSLIFKRCAASALGRAVRPADAKCIWRTMLVLQSTLAQQRPRHSFGTNMVLRLMEWDCALYRAARQVGMAEPDAKRLVEEINWGVLGPSVKMSFAVSRIRSSVLVERVTWIVDLMFRVVFTAPFRRNAHPRTDEIAFDVVVCPLAQYFNAQGLPELTSAAACSLDHRMASVWGMTLHRAQTIAEGHSVCDFHFRAIEQGRTSPPN
jgi:hypothetical protein